jgi:hypothetical protein
MPSAINTAFHVKTISMPNVSCRKPPIGPRRPNSFSRIKPVATGGMTSGSETSVSTTDLPGHSRRASSHATAIPPGKIASVLNADTQAVNQTTCQSAADMRATFER